MKKFFYLLLIILPLKANFIKTTILSIDNKNNTATVKIDHIQKGVSGIVVHKIAKGIEVITNNAEVISYDKTSKIATLKLSPHVMFVSNSLPNGKWKAQKGDIAILAFGYHRGLIIAPDEDSYYKIKSALKGEATAHPDIFATFLSTQGHPTPLRKDFKKFCKNLTLGLLFFKIEKNVYTVDCMSFKILSVSEFPFETKEKKLPFYSRVPKIEANWFGEGSDELSDYAPYYYKLLLKENKDNKKLLEAIKNSSNKNVKNILE